MLRHLVRQGLPWPGTSCARPEIDGRPSVPECRGKLSSPKASRSGKTIFAVPVGNLCAVTIEPPRRQKDQLAAFRSFETKAKYGGQVVYARARPGMMRRNLPAVTSGAYGEYSCNYAIA